MAIWQVAFSFHLDNKKILFPDQEFSATLRELENEFPLEKSWCKDIIQYGSLESTCIEIYIENSFVDHISVRLDLRNLSKKQLQLICDFAIKNKFLMCHKNQTFVADYKTVKNIIRQSEAKKFLTDPIGFLTELEQNRSAIGQGRTGDVEQRSVLCPDEPKPSNGAKFRDLGQGTVLCPDENQPFNDTD